MQPTISPLGDSAFTITFGDSIDRVTNDRVISFFNFLKKQKFPGLKDIIPAYSSVTVVYDFFEVSSLTNDSPSNYVNRWILKMLEERSKHTPAEARVLSIPVCYDPFFGPDLEIMSRSKNICVQEIIELHTAPIYKVYMIGFLPGFAYMGKVDEKIVAPRKDIPAINIPAGSVGIAGEQTGIYPLSSPGGWNIIGRTPVKLFDAAAVSPSLFQTGDKVKFQPISPEEYHRITEEQ